MYIFTLCYGMYYLNDTSITINNILRFMSVLIKIYIDLCVFVTSRKKMVVNRVRICEKSRSDKHRCIYPSYIMVCVTSMIM